MKTLSDMANNSPKGGNTAPNSTTPTANAATSEQIHTLLGIVGLLNPYLTADDEEKIVDEEAKTSASSTFIRVCNRLDLIIEDNKRWDVAKLDEVVDSLRGMYDAQTDYMKKTGGLADAQRAEAEKADAPHLRRNVMLHVLNNGEYMAVDGDPSLTSTIKAVGNTPEEAAKLFDAIWTGKAQYEPFSVKIMSAPKPE